MSYHFFDESEMLGVEALSPMSLDLNLDNFSSFNDYDYCYGLQPSSNFSRAENFVYKAELTNAYLNNGTLDIVDQFEAENNAILNSFQSENAFSFDTGLDIDTVAGNRIKESLLYDAYSNKGYIDITDMFNAETEAYLQGPLEDYKFQALATNPMSCGGEFINDSLLTDSYLQTGTFDFGDIVDSQLTANLESFSIDYLF